MNSSCSLCAVAIIAGFGFSAAFNLLVQSQNAPPMTAAMNIRLGPGTHDHRRRASAPGRLSMPCSKAALSALHTDLSHCETGVPSQTSRDDLDLAPASRRTALRRCASILAAIPFATGKEARASGFSGSMDEMAFERGANETAAQETANETPPPPAAQVAPSPGSSQEVTIPTEQALADYRKESEQADLATKLPPSLTDPTITDKDEPNREFEGQEEGMSFVAELGTVGVALAGIALVVSGRIEPNTDELTAKCKVVMIANEPYGLAAGRRYYNGVDVTVNDPIPASDIRDRCDAGELNDDCVETIAGFLGEVSRSRNGMEPSPEQRETAAAVLSYLNSLSSPSRASGGNSTETAVAFSSYLNGLSKGEIDAPGPPRPVADYLASLGEAERRLTDIENKIDALESSVDRLPDEISRKVQQWQERQDERLAKEFVKIEEYLVKHNNGVEESPAINGEARARSTVPW